MRRSPRLCAVELHGGLGNQLFQVAAALEIVEGDLDRVRVLASPSSDLRLLESIVGRSLMRASPTTVHSAWPAPKALLKRVDKALKEARRQSHQAAVRLRLIEQRRKPLLPSERNEAASGVVRRSGSQAFARGYFQDVVWAPKHSMTLARVVMETVASRVPRASSPRTVVHVRGGDYRGLGWMLGDGYYHEVLVSGFLNPGECVGVVGDDAAAVSRVRELLEGSGIETRELPAINDPVEAALRDFSAIANATRVVMSNSTFCWWATRAGDAARSERHVAYPSGWIDGDASTRHSKALCVPGWKSFPSPLSNS